MAADYLSLTSHTRVHEQNYFIFIFLLTSPLFEYTTMGVKCIQAYKPSRGV